MILKGDYVRLSADRLTPDRVYLHVELRPKQGPLE